ncbi:MAG: MBOAT family protein, partial [Nitrospinota bacterium]|nr:MBOAT family protein [Nitrospinota bacterium]
MSFADIGYWLFLPTVLLLYQPSSLLYRKFLLLAASWFFYSMWSFPFLFLLIYSSLADYHCALAVEKSKSERRRKLFLAVSLASNLGPLIFFKYFVFLNNTLNDALGLINFHIPAASFNIILPLGISFYTFQTMTYSLDVYNRKFPAERNRLDFMLYVAFFPQLVAGPIVRAQEFLPQIKSLRHTTEADFCAGAELIVSGLIKKLIFANNFADFLEPVFKNPGEYSGITCMLAVAGFGIQIYGDFSGYTDIGRGSARLFGFDLPINFDKPYLARSPRDFWRRWHITLSVIIRDYVYIPLGGNRSGKTRQYINAFVSMTICGLWHGAAYHFIVWGMYHGVGLVLYDWLFSGVRKHSGERENSGIFNAIIAAAGGFITFIFVQMGWIFFRAESMTIACDLPPKNWTACR